MEEKNRDRILRFIKAFEELYGRKPTMDDVGGDFKIRVAHDMQMSVGGARYYLRMAVEYEDEKT